MKPNHDPKLQFDKIAAVENTYNSSGQNIDQEELIAVVKAQMLILKLNTMMIKQNPSLQLHLKKLQQVLEERSDQAKYLELLLHETLLPKKVMNDNERL
jgi:hypothetical protein